MTKSERFPFLPIKTAENPDKDLEIYSSSVANQNRLGLVVLALIALVVFDRVQISDLSKRLVAQKPVVVRVSEVGRAEAVDFKINDYTPMQSELKYFLTEFVTDYFGRDHSTVRKSYVRSKAFLDEKLYNQITEADRRSGWAAKFISSTDDDANIVVKNVALDSSNAPKDYEARVDYEKVYTSNTGYETKREKYSVAIHFTIDLTLAGKRTDVVRYNPLGFAINSISSPDQAFKEE